MPNGVFGEIIGNSILISCTLHTLKNLKDCTSFEYRLVCQNPLVILDIYRISVHLTSIRKI